MKIGSKLPFENQLNQISPKLHQIICLPPQQGKPLLHSERKLNKIRHFDSEQLLLHTSMQEFHHHPHQSVFSSSQL